MFCRPPFWGMCGHGMAPVAGTGPVMYAQPVVHPTNHVENHTYCTIVVPHVFPTHVTTVHHHMVQHQASHPCTQSECSVTQDLGMVACPTNMMPMNMAPSNMMPMNMAPSNVGPTMKGHHCK